MNYIRHLTAFYSRVKHDPQLTPFHISLYMAIFQYWNHHRFQPTFPIHRDSLMHLSRIGSKNTYHKCIKELHQKRYIHYHPPVSKFQPIKITIISLQEKEASQPDLFNPSASPKTGTPPGPKNATASVPHLTLSGPTSGTGTVPKMGQYIKQNSKHINSVCKHPHIKEVEIFFHAQNYPPEEAQKFFWYNQSKNWMLTPQNPITDWKAAAQKWILNINTKTKQHAHTHSKHTGTNNPSNNPDYTQPL